MTRVHHQNPSPAEGLEQNTFKIPSYPNHSLIFPSTGSYHPLVPQELQLLKGQGPRCPTLGLVLPEGG